MFCVKMHEFAQQLTLESGFGKMKVMFAGAGTAGHVEPALAVANWLRHHYSDIDFQFLGTAGGVENILVPEASFELLLIEKAPFPRGLGREMVFWPFKFRRTLVQTQKLLQGTDVVVGFGGYVAAPAYLAAKRLGLPVIAHEANAKMGLANLLAKWSGAQILRAFGEGSQPEVGIPLRNTIIELAKLSLPERQSLKREALREMNLDPLTPTILVFGGSLGSTKFNLVISQARNDILQRGFQIIHAVGNKNELPAVQEGYFPVHYISNMAQAYAASDLVICRSGAVTVTETGVLGIYSLYVPLPIGNGEQMDNAQLVVKHAGGSVIPNDEFSPAWLTSHIVELMKSALAWQKSGLRMDFPLNASELIAQQIVRVSNDE